MAYTDNTPDPNNPYTATDQNTLNQPKPVGTPVPGPGTPTTPQQGGGWQSNGTFTPIQFNEPNGTPAPTVASQTPPASTGGAFNGSSFYGKTDPSSINSYVQGMLAGTGREGDAAMWANYITSKGGGPNSYWDNLITKNIGGDAAAGGGGGAAGGGAYVPGQGVPGQGTIFGSSNPNNANISALEAQLMGVAAQDQQPVTPNDPIIKAQTDAYNAQQQQAARQGETAAAERVGGSNTANLGAEARSASEQVGQATSGFEAQAMQRELDARRQQLQQMLSQYGNQLTAEQQMQLQEELTQLGIAQGANQFQTNQNNVLNNFPPA